MSDRFLAKDRYKDKNLVSNYDSERFTSVKGRMTHSREVGAMLEAMKDANVRPGASVLDAPCGTARFSMHLVGMGYKVTGADISPAMVEASLAKAAEAGVRDKTRFLVSDAEKMPFADGEFDCVCSLRFLGHVPPDVRVRILREFSRVSKGPLVLAYYYSFSLSGFLRKRKRTAAGIPWYPVSFSGLDAELKAAGVKKMKVHPIALGLSETVVVLAHKQ